MENTLLGGRYEIRDLLGGGGMGKVFLAKDRVLGREVALKVLRGQYAESEEFVERFEREAKAAASINHPNVVSVFDRGEDEDGSPYIAMEHVPGGTLKERVLTEVTLDAAEATRLAAQMADALGAAHERGVVHRDVKPQNVLLTVAGDAKVADFGIVRAAEAASFTTGSLVLGTAKYMSPEQAMGETVGPASDLYSLGVVLYEMLTGEVPFDADSTVGVAMKHVMEPPRPPKEINPRVPDALNAVVMKLLEKRPENRYPGAAELVADLRRSGEGLAPVFAAPPMAEGTETEPLAAPVVPFNPSGGARRDFARRRPRRLLALAGIVALLGLTGWGLLRGAESPVVGALEGAVTNAFEGVQQSLKLGVGEVPEVEGLAVAAARERLTEEGFGAVVERRESSEEAEGEVLEQSVVAGEEVERGSRIALAVGGGPGTVKAPDLVGLTPTRAQQELEEAGLKIGDREEAPSEEVPEGEVAAQDPRAGDEAKKGTEVHLKISSGPPKQEAAEKTDVPDVLGLGTKEATVLLEKVGLKLAGTRTESSFKPAGTVTGADPSVGSSVAAGTPITLIVSGGPETPAQDDAGGEAEPAPASSPATASASSTASANSTASSPTPEAPPAPSSPQPAPLLQDSASPEPASPEPASAEPAPTEPAPAPSEPAPTEPTPTEPAPLESAPLESAPSSVPAASPEPAPSQGEPSPPVSPTASAQPTPPASPAGPIGQGNSSMKDAVDDAVDDIVEDAMDAEGDD